MLMPGAVHGAPHIRPGAAVAVAAVGLAQDLRKRIEVISENVARLGVSFEQTVKEKHAGNPEFAFLTGGEGVEYYMQLLQAHRSTQIGGASGAARGVGCANGQTEGFDLAEILGRWREPNVAILPPETDRQLAEVLASLEHMASRDSIKNGRMWIEANVSLAGAIAGNAMKRIGSLATCAHRLHVLFLLHDALQTEHDKKEPIRPLINAFKPHLVWMLRSCYQMATTAAPGDEGEKVLKLMRLWGERAILSAREAEEVRLIVMTKELPHSWLHAGAPQGSPVQAFGGPQHFGYPGGPVRHPAGVPPVQAMRMVFAQPPPPPPHPVPGMPPAPLQPGLLPTPTLLGRGAQTPETVPVGVMASMLKQVSRRGKDMHTAFVPYKPLDPLYTPQSLPPVPPPSDQLLERLREYYELVGDAAKPVVPPMPVANGFASDAQAPGFARRSKSRSRSGERARSKDMPSSCPVPPPPVD